MSDTTEIIILLDRSGSMASIRETAVEGINRFIEEVRKEPGDGFWTIAQFDDRDSAAGGGETFPHFIYDRVPDSEVRPLRQDTYRPRGSTALVDAVCETIRKVKQRHDDSFIVKPRVMFVVVTDGEENASKEFTSGKLRELVAEVSEKRGWKFLYLAANVDAFHETKKYGMGQPVVGYAGMAADATNHMNWQHTSHSLTSGAVSSGCVGNAYDALASGAFLARAWKADGNPTVDQLMGSCAPDNPSETTP